MINKCNFYNLLLSANTTSSYDERFIESQYRSGNAQRAYSGTEFRRLSVALDFLPMDETSKNSLNDFYEIVGLVLYFSWTPTDETYPTDKDDARVFRFSTPVSFISRWDKYGAQAVVEEVPNGTPSTNGDGDAYTADPVPYPQFYSIGDDDD